MSGSKKVEEALCDRILLRHEGAIYSERRGRFEAAIPNDNEVNLPVVFLRELHERGYKAVNMPYGGDPFFKAISMQVLVTAGVVYTVEELKADLIEFERNYAHYLKQSEFLTYVTEREGDNSAFDNRVQDLENNLRAADSFDIYCMSLFLNVEILVLYPDMIDKNVCECVYNESGSRRLRLVLVNDGWLQYNDAVLPVYKENWVLNP